MILKKKFNNKNTVIVTLKLSKYTQERRMVENVSVKNEINNLKNTEIEIGQIFFESLTEDILQRIDLRRKLKNETVSIWHLEVKAKFIVHSLRSRS